LPGAESLLNKRGVPYTIVDVQRDEQGLIRMKSLSGEDRAPVLALGDKIIVKGYSEQRWQAALDEAGYPKTPTQRRTVVGGGPRPRSHAARLRRKAAAPLPRRSRAGLPQAVAENF
jgi:glutaredoxin